MTSLRIDGRHQTGRYHVNCRCGVEWSGFGVQQGIDTWNPSLPIAEAVAHHQLDHDPHEYLNVDFSPTFRRWLLQYWEDVTRRSTAAAMRLARHQTGF